MLTYLSTVCLCSVFGISPIIQSDCSYTWKLIVNSKLKWYHFVSPIMLLILYYTLATLIRLWLQEPIDQLMVRTADRRAPTEHKSRTFRVHNVVMFSVVCIKNTAAKSPSHYTRDVKIKTVLKKVSHLRNYILIYIHTYIYTHPSAPAPIVK